MKTTRNILLTSILSLCALFGVSLTTLQVAIAQTIDASSLPAEAVDAGEVSPAIESATEATELEPTEAAAREAEATPDASESKTAEDVAEDPVNAVGEMVGAFRAGNWREFAAILLSFIMLGFAKSRDKLKFFRGDRGGVISIFVISSLGAIITSLFGSAPIDLLMFARAGEIAVLAIGGFIGIKKLFWPSDKEA